MEGLGTVFGVVALLVSLAALWFVNDAVRRIERDSKQVVDSHLKTAKDSLDGCVAKVAGLEKKAEDLARQLAELKKKQDELLKAQGEHHGQVAAMREDLDRLGKEHSAAQRRARRPE